MRAFVKLFGPGLAVVCLGAAMGFAQQQPASSDTSLGDIARQLKAQKAKAKEPKPAVVMTNDTLGGTKGEANASKKTAAEPATTQAPPATEKHDAEYFRSRDSKLQDQLSVHKRELSVLQQKLGQNQMQYYPNPQDSLMQQYSRGDIDKLNAEIDAKKQQVDDDEKALDDLHEQLRREGGDPAWLRQ